MKFDSTIDTINLKVDSKLFDQLIELKFEIFSSINEKNLKVKFKKVE